MYVPLHAHSEYSLLDGLSKAWQMAARVRRSGMSACAISDHGNVGGVVSFQKAMQGACKHCGYQPNQHFDGGKGRCSLSGIECPGYEKSPMKAILGCEFYVTDQDASIRDKTNPMRHLVVLSKNLEGWKQMCKAVSLANSAELFYRKPRLDLGRLASFCNGNWVSFSGHPGSALADVLFTDPKQAYAARSEDDVRSFLKPWRNLKRELVDLARKHEDVFGKGNFFIEKSLFDGANLPAAIVIGKAMDWTSKETGILRVAAPDAHYPAREDAEDQRVLLCAAVDTTLQEAERKLTYGEDFGLSGFFRSNRYGIPTPQEMAIFHEPDELKNSIAIAEMCEPYDITGKPRLPKFDCPDGMSADDYLKKLCREGWTRKVAPLIDQDPSKKAVYGDRVKKELGVLQEAGLSPYFLIVEDFCRYAHQVLRCKPSKGRGSAAGCLVSHLLNVADCDPIEYGLLFERFYNAGRNSPGRIALPDIDCDFPTTKREKVIDYIRAKYGDDKVAQMATFGRLQGRDALTTVLRAHQWGSFEERKGITAYIPDESSIADELQEMREETGEASIIKWALENEAEGLKEWCVLKDDGSLEGPLSKYFAQAMRIEGTKKTQGKHPSGIIISPEPLADLYPMLYDKSSGRCVVGYEMGAVEASGGVKFDILGVTSIDKVMGAVRTIACGKVGIE